jgi:hypothetical protein
MFPCEEEGNMNRVYAKLCPRCGEVEAKRIGLFFLFCGPFHEVTPEERNMVKHGPPYLPNWEVKHVVCSNCKSWWWRSMWNLLYMLFSKVRF